MYEKLQEIKRTFGETVAVDVYKHYDIKRARAHQAYDTATVLADIESDKTFVGKIKFLWLKYPNRYDTIDITDLPAGYEVTDEDLRSKDYCLIAEKACKDNPGDSMVIAEILEPTTKPVQFKMK